MYVCGKDLHKMVSDFGLEVVQVHMGYTHTHTHTHTRTHTHTGE